MAAQRLVVQETGPVDADWNPMPQELSDDSDNTNTTKHLFDLANNKKVINFWNLQHIPRPYFMDDIDQNSNEQHKRLIWVEGSIETTLEAANNSIIEDPARELNVGDCIRFRERERRYWWHSQSDDDFVYGRQLQGQIIAIGDDDNHGRKFSVLLLCEGEADDQMVEIFANRYEITRYEQASGTESRLFTLKVSPQTHFIAQFLSSVLPGQPWLSLMEIASFLDCDYAKHLYFDYKAFEHMVFDNYQFQCEKEDRLQLPFKSCTLCTFDNVLESELCEICGSPLLSPDHDATGNDAALAIAARWLAQDACYENKIHSIAHQMHATFPSAKQRDTLYAKHPFLVQIEARHRTHLKGIRERLSASCETALFKYQLHTVLWCYIVEQVIAKHGCKLCIGADDLRFTRDPNVECAVYALHDTRFIPALPGILPPRLLSFKGGIISDEVGLGKTLTMLSVCVADDDPIASDAALGPNQRSIRCGATLLVVPARLIEQWQLEIRKHFRRDTFTVVAIMTSSDHKCTNYRKLLDANIVLVAHEFLRTFAPTESRAQHWDNLDPALPSEPAVKVVHTRRNPRPKFQDLHQLKPFFELLHWRRIILDEAHEVDRNLTQELLCIPSDFSWYISATPFPRAENVAFAAKFLGIQFEGDFYDAVDWNQQIGQPLGSVLHSIFYHHLFSRHTVNSILDDNYLPEIEESAEFVEFHPVERLFYEIAPTRNGHKTLKEIQHLQRRICSGVLADFVDAADFIDDNGDEANRDLSAVWTANKLQCVREICSVKQQISVEQTDLELQLKYELKLQMKRREFAERGKEFTYARAFSALQAPKYRNCEQRIRSRKHRLEGLSKQLKRWQAELEIVDKCGIDIEQRCANYAQKFQDGILMEFVQKYGSKNASILAYIKAELAHDEKHHIIIFSFFNSTLEQIKQRLSLMGLNSVFVQGSSYQQRKAIRGFTNLNASKYKVNVPRARIMLLCVEDRASGTDLNMATHVVLVDPVPGKLSESFAAEKQAIGRAVRQGSNLDKKRQKTKVVRFVVNNTIEHETYYRNMKIRKQMMERCEIELNDYLVTKREQHEIDFYVNINRTNNKRKLKGCVDGGVLPCKKRKTNA